MKQDKINYVNNNYPDMLEETSDTLQLDTKLNKISKYLINLTQLTVNFKYGDTSVCYSLYEHLKVAIHSIHEVEIVIKEIKHSCEANWKIPLNNWVKCEIGVLEICTKLHLLALSAVKMSELDEFKTDSEQIGNNFKEEMVELSDQCALLSISVKSEIYSTISLIKTEERDTQLFIPPHSYLN